MIRSTSWARRAIASVLLLSATTVVRAQLSDADIEALRAQGEREGWTFTVARNGATDRPLSVLTGVVVPPDWRKGARFDNLAVQRELPASYDWRNVGGQSYITAIRDQGGCGSCWAFGLCGAVEANIFIKDGTPVDLSEQWLVSCCGLGGCSGEWPGNAVNFFLCSGQYTDSCGEFGAVLEQHYPYMGYDATCTCPFPHTYCLDNWAFVGPEWGIPTTEQLKQALLDHGPLCVCVNASSAFQGYSSGVFNACTNTEINHCVTLVGWNDDQGPNGVWIIKNSWGPGWGESGYMRITYGCCLIGYNSLYVDYGGLPPRVAFAYPDGQPTHLLPGRTTDVRVDVLPNTGQPVTGSGLLHFAINGGAYQTAPMIETTPNAYVAKLPAASCFDRVRWYVSAEEATEGAQSDPVNAPESYFDAMVASGFAAQLSESFEQAPGWTVQNVSISSGAWERGVPAGVGDRYDPAQDFDGSGQCYLTGNWYGDSDVDGGPTRLVSPVLALDPALHYRLQFAAWIKSDDPNDALTVQLSNNGGFSWITADQVVPNLDGWSQRMIELNDFLPPSANVVVRFNAQDNPNNSVTEAGIDGFTVLAAQCGFAAGDMNCDGAVDFGDINAFVGALLDPAAYTAQYPSCDPLNGDLNDSGAVDFGDINAFVDLLL